MTDPDLRELAELWQQPDGDAQELFEAVARKARFRARFLGYADLALGLLLVAGMVLGTIMVPGPVTAGIAVLLISATIWVSFKRRALRQMSLTLDTNDRHSFIRVAARSARANYRRLTLGLWLFPPFALLAVLFKLSWRQGGELHDPLQALALWAVSTRGIIGLCGIAVIVGLLLRSWRKTRAEIRRLEALDRDYRDEDRMDGDADA